MTRLGGIIRNLRRDVTAEVTQARREAAAAEERALSAERRLEAARLHGDATRLVAEGHAARLERVWQLLTRWDGQPGRAEAAAELRQALHGGGADG